jgi:hypothetical protein
MKKTLISLSLSLLLAPSLFAQASDDNEIMIEQSGDTLTLYIDQIGYGNKIGLDDFSSSGSDMTIVGSSLTFDIDMVGNQNLIYGPLDLDSSSLTFSLLGDSNEVDWNIGYVGSSDDSDYNFDITGDSNTFDLDQGYVYSAERLDADLILIGSSNIFDLDFEADDSTWTFDITGDSNNINTLQNDGAQSMVVELVGDSADIDINQISGTCATGAGVACVSPNAVINLDITSDNATIQINQQDTNGDS